MNRIKLFLAEEDGATVVDMTMLMAALVSLSLAITVQVSNGMENLSGDIADSAAGIEVGAAW